MPGNFTTVSDATGYYQISGLTLGVTYYVTVAKAGYVFTPSTRTLLGLTADATGQDFTYGKRWSGGGLDNLASNGSNWLGGVAPSTGDVARFDSLNSTKSCTWDIVISTVIEAIQLAPAFSTSVVTVVDIQVATVSIAGGEFIMRSTETRITRNFIHTGGKFRAAPSVTAIFQGTTTQRVQMVKTSLGGGLYENYFSNFRLQASSAVQAVSELVIDGTFNISTGRFEALTSTLTLTGGTQSGLGGTSNWDDSAGVFTPGSGAVVFDSTVGGAYLIRQGASNSFFNLTGTGASDLTLSTGTRINGNLVLGGSGSSVRMSLTDTYSYLVAGTASIGPASTSGAATLSMGASTMTFQGAVVVGTASFSVQGGRVNVQGSRLEVTSQGTLDVKSGASSRFVFNDASQLNVSVGTLTVQSNSVFTSSAPNVTHFATDFRGTINFSTGSVFDSLDVNGFQLGAGASITNMKALDFRNGPVGGAAINFNPVPVSSVTVDSPVFDASISTNVRAVVNPSVVANADIDVIRGTGAATGPTLEYDPSNVVNWGTSGTPTGFTGTVLGVSSITWTWTINGNPLGFVVRSSTGGALSTNLSFSTTFWTETALSTNTQYARYVEAFTDSAQFPSSGATNYTFAAAPSTVSVVDVGISSITITWSANTNPAPTIFFVERSTDDATYTRIASNTLSALVPYLDQGLTANKLYYYRVRAQNGDGVVALVSNKISTSTVAVPPPSIISILPSSGTNLGTVSVMVTGANIQDGAIVKLKRTGQTTIVASSSQFVSATSINATFGLTGKLAGTWDVEIENPDDLISVGSGSGLFTVVNASSTGSIHVQAFTSSTGLSLTTSGGESTLTMGSGAMNDGRIYLSFDPEDSPLSSEADLIEEANDELTGLTLVPGSIREILAFTNTGLFTSGFGSIVTLGISYTDANGDGILDNVPLRASGLRIITLNTATNRWQALSASSVDTATRRVSAVVSHFSIYALAGSPAATDLSEVKAYPSPWRPGSSTNYDATEITISNLTDAGTIRIYSLSAVRVKEILYEASNAGLVAWDGKDEDGKLVPSGVYLINIKSSAGESETLKLGIQR